MDQILFLVQDILRMVEAKMTHSWHLLVISFLHLVAIYYLNTCDGYTYFKGGTKVESIANRIIIFPSEVWHGGTSVTNADRRVVINFNYY